MDFDHSVPHNCTGARVLITSPSFPGLTYPPAVSDFLMTSLVPKSYVEGGSITFENNLGTQVLWRLSWGTYSGETAGETTNDADGEFGPPWPDQMPALWSHDGEALLFEGPAEAPSTSNADDYALTAGKAVFTNNAGASFPVVLGPGFCPWDCDSGDGIAGVTDLLALLGQYDPMSPDNCTGGSCDYNGDGCVDVVDLLKLLAHYDPAGLGCP